MLNRLDEMKVEAGKAVGEEISKFLAQIEVNKELKRALNGMVIDIRTEVRFKYDSEADDSRRWSPALTELLLTKNNRNSCIKHAGDPRYAQ